MTVFTEILDYGLLAANLYVLLRIRISKEEAFRTPFFYWFFTTGQFAFPPTSHSRNWRVCSYNAWVRIVEFVALD